MDINQAKRLIPGMMVNCPADRGNPGFDGVVTHVGTEEYKNSVGARYIWVTVKEIGYKGNSAVWPSNRLW